jgi:hypothetical protein
MDVFKREPLQLHVANLATFPVHAQVAETATIMQGGELQCTQFSAAQGHGREEWPASRDCAGPVTDDFGSVTDGFGCVTDGFGSALKSMTSEDEILKIVC